MLRRGQDCGSRSRAFRPKDEERSQDNIDQSAAIQFQSFSIKPFALQLKNPEKPNTLDGDDWIRKSAQFAPKFGKNVLVSHVSQLSIEKQVRKYGIRYPQQGLLSGTGLTSNNVVRETMVRLLMIASILACTDSNEAQNYPQFRGQNSDAASALPLPVTWSDAEGNQTNIKWKIQVPGEGWSQPIVWGNRVYITAAAPVDKADQDKIGPEVHDGGYGRDRNDLVDVDYKYQVFCIDAETGERVWERTVKTGKPPIPRHSTNTYATETPVTNGERIYAYFGMNGVHCLDMDGKIVWQKDLGAFEMRAGWGTASSPTLLKNHLFIQVDNEQQSFLIALDTNSGQELWRVDRDERSQYSSPIIWKNSVRDELILGGMVYRSYDPATGKLLWKLDMNKGRSSATPIAFGDRLYVGNELRNRGGADDGGGGLFRIKPGGSGDITPKNGEKSGEFVEWRTDDSGIQMASPTHLGGNLYFFERRLAIVHCVDADTGRIEYKKRVPGGREFWASPWTDGKFVFAMDSSGNTHVIAPGDEFKVVNVNRLDQHAWGTPAVAGGCIYLRTAKNLYCISKK